MALRNQRGRLQAGDNAVAGSQTTSFENTTVGNLPPVELAGGNAGAYSNVSVGNAPPTTVINDDIQVGVTTLTRENPAVGG